MHAGTAASMGQAGKVTSPTPVSDLRDLRRALGSFPTGITIVTSRHADGTLCGLTANSFTSVSLSPPLLLVCIANSRESFGVFASAERFSVSILSNQQREISEIFASGKQDKFASVEWQRDDWGAAIISNSHAWFSCRTYKQVDAGDHLVLIGEVKAFGHRPASPLAYYRGHYSDLVGARCPRI